MEPQEKTMKVSLNIQIEGKEVLDITMKTADLTLMLPYFQQLAKELEAKNSKPSAAAYR